MNKKIFSVTVMIMVLVVGVAAEAKTFRYSTSGDVLGLDPYTNNEGPGALADLIVVDGDPVADIGLLSGQGEAVLMVMKGGAVYKDMI